MSQAFSHLAKAEDLLMPDCLSISQIFVLLVDLFDYIKGQIKQIGRLQIPPPKTERNLKLKIEISWFKYFWTVMAKNTINCFVRFLGESMARQSVLGFIDLYNHNVNCLINGPSFTIFSKKNKVRQCFPIRKAREFFARK